LFSTREFTNGPIRIYSCTDKINGLLDTNGGLACLATVEKWQGQSPVPAIESKPHNAPPTYMHIRLKMPPLGNVANNGIAPPSRMTEHRDLSSREWKQSKDGLEERGLACPIGTENSEKFSRLDRKLNLLPDGPPSQVNGCVFYLDDRRKSGRNRCGRSGRGHIMHHKITSFGVANSSLLLP
jgi:hypothetical protein